MKQSFVWNNYLWIVTQQHHPTFQLQWQVIEAPLRCLHTADELTVFRIKNMLQCLLRQSDALPFCQVQLKWQKVLHFHMKPLGLLSLRQSKLSPISKREVQVSTKAKIIWWNKIKQPSIINHQSLTFKNASWGFFLVDFTGCGGHLVSRPCLQHTAGTAPGRIKTCRLVTGSLHGSPEVESWVFPPRYWKFKHSAS